MKPKAIIQICVCFYLASTGFKSIAQERSLFIGFGPQVDGLRGETMIGDDLSVSSDKDFRNMVPEYTLGYVQDFNNKLSLQLEASIGPSRHSWRVSSNAGFFNAANTFVSRSSHAIGVSPKIKYRLPLPTTMPVRFSLMGGSRIFFLTNRAYSISESDDSQNVPILRDIAEAVGESTRSILPFAVIGGNVEWKNLSLQLEYSRGLASVTRNLDLDIASSPNQHFADFLNLRLGYTFWFAKVN